MDAPTAQDIPALAAVVADMQVLADTADTDFAAALGPLGDAYETWIVEQEQHLVNPAPDLAPYLASGQLALANCRGTLARIRAGIALLGSNPQAADAFRFANRAMWRQRVRSLFTRAIRRGQPAEPEHFDIPANRRWYPFQLAFMLLNLPALANPADPDRSDPTQALADLLWFPTGGGKTEAYLGGHGLHPGLSPPHGYRSRRVGRGRAHALYPASAYPAAVPARYRAHLRLRGHPPRRSRSLGRGAVPHRSVGGAGQQRGRQMIAGARQSGRGGGGLQGNRRGWCRRALLEEIHGHHPCGRDGQEHYFMHVGCRPEVRRWALVADQAGSSQTER
jgi:hypothetical protein